MRNSMLTFLFAVFMPLAFASSACFLTTEGERYSYDSYGGGTGGDCPIGHEGCACTSGGQCNQPFHCDQNLNICLSDPCPRGSAGCLCTTGGACDSFGGAAGGALLCLSGYCVDPGPQCPPGTEACPCTEGGGCDPGLDCLSNYCVDTSGVTGGNTDAGEEGDDDSTGGGSGTTATTGAADETGNPDPDSTSGAVDGGESTSG